MTDFDRFAEPIDGESPCGPDCEYDNDFLALSQAVAGKPEQQFGDTVIPAVEPDWRQVDTLAQALLGRSRDLRVVCWLALANTRLHGVSAFVDGLKLIVSLCERYWDEVHPRIEVDGDTDPYLRMNAISAFTGGSEFSGEDQLLQALRGSVLTTEPVELTYRDLELSFSKAPDATYSLAQLESILTDAVAAGNTNVSLVQNAWQSYQALCKLIDERVNTGDAPAMERLGAVLKPVAQGIERMNSASTGASAMLCHTRPPSGLSFGSRPVRCSSRPRQSLSAALNASTSLRSRSARSSGDPVKPGLSVIGLRRRPCRSPSQTRRPCRK